MTAAVRVAVVGAGISGVGAAHYLKQLGFEPEILEAGPVLGGRVGSLRLGERDVDIGGKNIGRRYARFRSFMDAHGSPPLEYFGINSSTVRDGKLYTVDSQNKLSSLWRVLSLVGPRDFARLARLASAVWRSPDEGMLGAPGFAALSEQHDQHPLSEWFGERANQAFLRPITLRMNGAEPSRYYLGCLGSNLRMVLDRYDQLSLGMGDLLERFARTTRVSLNTRVTRLLFEGRRVSGVEIEHAGKREQRRYAAVVLALPAAASAELLRGETIGPSLAAVAYNPVTLVVAKYDRPIFDARVRALVLDRDSPVSNAGCYGANDLDMVRYTFSGRAAAGIDAATPVDKLLDVAEEQLGRFVPVQRSWRVRHVAKHFQQGLCAYGPYHHRFIAQLREWERGLEGIALTGDYLRGASIEACFQAAFECAERIAARRLHLLAVDQPTTRETFQPAASRLSATGPNELAN